MAGIRLFRLRSNGVPRHWYGERGLEGKRYTLDVSGVSNPIMLRIVLDTSNNSNSGHMCSVEKNLSHAIK